MASHMVITMEKAGAVNQALLGHFKKAGELSLILGKVGHICLYDIVNEDLTLLHESPINGRVVALEKFCPSWKKKDAIAVLTAKHHFSILIYEEGQHRFKALLTGIIPFTEGYPIRDSVSLSVHDSGVFSFLFRDGTLRFLKYKERRNGGKFNELKVMTVELPGEQVFDAVFLSASRQIILAYSFLDECGDHLHYYELDVKNEIEAELIAESCITSESLLIPLDKKYGGVMFINKKHLMYLKENNMLIALKMDIMLDVKLTCFTAYKDKEVFVGDERGDLFLIEIFGLIFVGSKYGDSQLIRLNREKKDGLNVYDLIVLRTFINISPVADCIYVENDKKDKIITCSGKDKNGSLRIITNGSTIKHVSSLDLLLITGIFTINLNSVDKTYIIVCYYNTTRVFRIVQKILVEIGIRAIEPSVKTLLAGQMLKNDAIVQITSDLVKICNSHEEFVIWHRFFFEIDHATVNFHSGEIITVCGPSLFYLRYHADAHRIEQIAFSTGYCDVTFIDIHDNVNGDSAFFALSYGVDHSFALFNLPGFEKVFQLRNPSVPRYLTVATMEDIIYLFVALDDGHVLFLTIEEGNAYTNEVKKIYAGDTNVTISKFVHKGKTHIFVGSAYPMLISRSNKKLIFVRILSDTLYSIKSLGSGMYSNYCITSNLERVSLTEIDVEPKIHIDSIPLGETVTNIVHQPETKTYGIACIRDEKFSDHALSRKSLVITKYDPERGVHGCNRSLSDVTSSFVLLDENTMKPLHTYELAPHERIVSLISTTLGSDPNAYFILGTVAEPKEMIPPTIGRVVFLKTSLSNQLELTNIFEYPTVCSPLALSVIQSKLVVAVENCIIVYSWDPARIPRMSEESTPYYHSTVGKLKTNNNVLLVDNPVHSLSMLCYDPYFDTMDLTASYNRKLRISAMGFNSDTTFVASDFNYNIFSGGMLLDTFDSLSQMMNKGQFYIGERISVFMPGCLRASTIANTIELDHQLMYATLDGSIGVIARIPSKYRKLMADLQTEVSNRIENCTKIPHNIYREYQLVGKPGEPAHGFIDGDLIESILEMSVVQQRKIFRPIKLFGRECKQSDEKCDDILRFIEDIRRNH